MQHGRLATTTRAVPGSQLSPRDHGGRRKAAPQAVHGDEVPGRDRMGARQRIGPKAFTHQGNWAWIADAACHGADARQFFPEDHFNLKDPEQFTEYLSEVAAINDAYCAGCPVRVNCEDHARVHREPTGIWGGEGPLERGVWK